MFGYGSLSDADCAACDGARSLNSPPARAESGSSCRCPLANGEDFLTHYVLFIRWPKDPGEEVIGQTGDRTTLCLRSATGVRR